MPPPKVSGAARGTVRSSSWAGTINFTIRAAPLPPAILEFLLENISILAKVRQGKTENATEEFEVEDIGAAVRRPTVGPEQFWSVLQEKCREQGGEWKDLTERIWAFGPHWAGSCILVDARSAVSVQS
jgi:ribosome assembly protein 1